MSVGLNRASYLTLVEATWACDSAPCPVIAFDGHDPTCPACGMRAIPADDWEENQEIAAEQKVYDDHGTDLCCDEIQGRAKRLTRRYDEMRVETVIEELKAIIDAAERLRPAREGDS